MGWFFLFYFVWLAVISGYTFICYGVDKRAAQLKKDRTPEKRLHLLSLLGGWPGAIWGRKFFRHKTKKKSFQLTETFAIAGHLFSVTAIYALIFRLF